MDFIIKNSSLSIKTRDIESKIATYEINDLSEGMSYEILVKMTREKILGFSQLTGDWHLLHSDEEYAKSNGFKTIIAHGLLISSFSSSIIGMSLPGKNSIIVSQEFEYINPVYPCDELCYKATIKKIRKNLGVIEMEIHVFNQNNLMVSNGKYRIKIRK